jgi:hypothetical protein
MEDAMFKSSLIEGNLGHINRRKVEGKRESVVFSLKSTRKTLIDTIVIRFMSVFSIDLGQISPI